MSSLSNEPMLKLPKSLQSQLHDLEQQRKVLDQKIGDLREAIATFRAECKHKRPGDLTGHEYAVYCAKCGEMIDSWL